MSSKSLGILLFLIGLVSFGCTKKTILWHEAENFNSTDENVEHKIGPRPPASGGLALNGTGIGGSGVGTFSAAGRSASFLADIGQNIPDAKIIFRYARLQWRADMKPAEFTCEVKNAGASVKLDLIFNDTRGWGMDGPSEWKLLEAGIGALKKGPAEISLTVNSKDGDITLDGFYIAPADLVLTDQELKDLSRVRFDHTGYIGINMPFSAVEQNDFRGFDIILRSFGRKSWIISSFLINEKDKGIVPLPGQTRVSTTDTMELNVKPEPVKDLEDGDYTLVVQFNDHKDSLTFPFTVLGNTVAMAEKMKAEYRNFIADNELKTEPGWKTVVDDIRYAADYIENTIIYLRAKVGYTEESERKKALSYFEKARNRSAQSFAADLKLIMNQSNETIERMKHNKDPYTGRPGDFRRAFISGATGKLEPYRIFIPSGYETGDKIPVMLVLHGGGGDENYYPDMDEGVIMKIMEKERIIMVSPRATSWFRDDGAKDMLQLVKLVLKEYPKADPSRVYCTGVSAGGSGTYNLAVEYPGVFAAIACVSGSSRDLDRIGNLRNTPCLLIQGGSDPVVSPEIAMRTSAKLKELGFPHELKMTPAYGHDYHSEEYMNYTLDFIRRYGK